MGAPQFFFLVGDYPTVGRHMSNTTVSATACGLLPPIALGPVRRGQWGGAMIATSDDTRPWPSNAAVATKVARCVLLVSLLDWRLGSPSGLGLGSDTAAIARCQRWCTVVPASHLDTKASPGYRLCKILGDCIVHHAVAAATSRQDVHWLTWLRVVRVERSLPATIIGGGNLEGPCSAFAEKGCRLRRD